MDNSDTVSVDQYAASIVEALVGVLANTVDEDTRRARSLLLQRLAVAGDVVPSRVPAPRNITEVGGYLNLLEDSDEPVLRAQVLAAILGVAGPTPPVGFLPTGPTLFPARRANDRPAGPGQAAVPVDFTVRSDLAGPLDAALAEVHARGGLLPVLRTIAPLPAVDTAPGEDLLAYVGRQLRLVPAVALRDPDGDAVAVARPDAGGDLRTVARVVDAGAPDAGSVAADDWVAWSCAPSGCSESTASRRYFDLAPILADAGWYQPTPAAPTPADSGGWDRWRNVTGLVAGETTLGDELRLLYTQAAITASSLRELTLRVWDGTGFAAA